jgi:hypothetical protein
VALYYAIEYGWKTRFLVPNRFLEDQYISDFGSLGLKQLHSACHYRCPKWGSCDIGRGIDIVRQPLTAIVHPVSVSAIATTPAATVTASKVPVKCKHQELCPYLKARTEFQGAPIAVTNSSFALTCARYKHDFVKSDLVVFDEAHNLGNQICSMYEVKVQYRLIDIIPAKGDEFIWLRDIYRPDIESQLKAASNALEDSQNPIEAKESEKDIVWLSTLLANIDTVLSSNPRDWIVSNNAQGLLFQPIWATKIAPSLLGFLSPRRLLMSATFLNQTVHLETLGL